jgi:hypothetical protein
MGWIEKFFCLSVDEECSTEIVPPSSDAIHRAMDGPIKKLTEQVDEEMLKKSPVVPYVNQGVASSDIEQWLMAERKAKNAVEVRGTKETVEGMRKREAKDSVEQSVPTKVSLPRNTKPDLIKHVLAGEGRIFKSLGDMFDWSDTPQGQAHWQSVASAYVARDGWDADQRYRLKKSDREYLEAVLVAYYDSLKKEPEMLSDKDSSEPSDTTTVDSYDAGWLPPGHVFCRSHEPACRLARQMISDGYMFEFMDRAVWHPCDPKENFEADGLYRQVLPGKQTQPILRGGRGEYVAGPQPEEPVKLVLEQPTGETSAPPVAGAPCPACKGPTQAMTFKHSGKDVDWCDRCKTGQSPEKSTHQFIGGGQQNTIDIRSSDGSRIGTCTITEPKTICLADHLKIQGQKYFIDLLADVNYVYGDAVLKLCGNNLRLDVDEVQKNLRKHMVRLREQLIDEVQSWFCGNGRLLETGPEIVDCYLSCSDNVWWLAEREAKSGNLGVAEEICSRLAHHLILASDVCNLLEEQKVMCLMNLILRR